MELANKLIRTKSDASSNVCNGAAEKMKVIAPQAVDINTQCDKMSRNNVVHTNRKLASGKR